MTWIDRIPKKNKSFLSKIINDEAVVISLDDITTREKSEIRVFNETATRIWELINGKNSIGDIMDKLGREYDVNDKILHLEVERILKNLYKKNIILFNGEK